MLVTDLSALFARDIARLIHEAVKDMIPRVVNGLSDSQMEANYPEAIHGKSITTRQFLMHLEAHLNYHLGQVDYLRRFATGHGAIDLATL